MIEAKCVLDKMSALPSGCTQGLKKAENWFLSSKEGKVKIDVLKRDCNENQPRSSPEEFTPRFITIAFRL